MFQNESPGFPDLAIWMSCVISKIMPHGMYSLSEGSTECMNCVRPMVFRKVFVGGFPRWSSREESVLPLQGVQAQALGGELRPCTLCGEAKKKKIENWPYLLRAMNFKMSQFVPRNSNQKTWKELSNTCNRRSLWVQVSITVMTTPASSWLILFLIHRIGTHQFFMFFFFSFFKQKTLCP